MCTLVDIVEFVLDSLILMAQYCLKVWPGTRNVQLALAVLWDGARGKLELELKLVGEKFSQFIYYHCLKEVIICQHYNSVGLMGTGLSEASSSWHPCTCGVNDLYQVWNICFLLCAPPGIYGDLRVHQSVGNQLLGM